MKRPRTLGQRPKADRRKQQDADRYKAKPWRRWYGLAIWCGPNGIRARQLAKQPLCERHLKRGLVVEADTVNHVDRHNGVWERFIRGPFESLCKPCHDRDVQREERAAGKAGLPIGGGPKV